MALVKAVEAGTVLRNELTPTQTAFLMAHRSADVRAGRGLRLHASGRRGSPRCAAALPGRRSISAATASGAGRRIRRGARRATSRAPTAARSDRARDGEELHAGRDPHAPARSQPDGRCAYRLYLVETKDGRSLTGIIQSETANQRDASTAVRPGQHADAVDHHAYSEPRAVDDAGRPGGWAVAAGHGGSAAVHSGFLIQIYAPVIPTSSWADTLRPSCVHRPSASKGEPCPVFACCSSRPPWYGDGRSGRGRSCVRQRAPIPGGMLDATGSPGPTAGGSVSSPTSITTRCATSGGRCRIAVPGAA